MAARLVVFGGSGYVGSHICKQAVLKGISVVSISRSGRPAWSEEWMDKVDWAKGDIFAPETYRPVLKDTTGCVVSVGAFGNNEHMERVCGDGPMQALETSKEEGVSRFGFISAQKAAGTPEGFLRGYFQGKQKVEARMRELYPEAHMVLQPGAVYGRRHVGGVVLPLGLLFAPLKALLQPQMMSSLEAIPLLGAGLVPPTNVDDISVLSSALVQGEEMDPRLVGSLDSRSISAIAPQFR